MPNIIFPSKWLKANVNVKSGDTIVFEDSGTFDKTKEQWVFNVRILRTGETKKFGLNKKNFTSISALYGTNSDDWMGKQMKVKLITGENPQGQEVEMIRLYDPNKNLADVGNTDEEEVIEYPDDGSAPNVSF